MIAILCSCKYCILILVVNINSIPDVPSAPINPQVTDVTSSECTLTWEAPKSDGGSPIIGYYIERSTNTRFTRVNKEPVTECVYDFDDLKEGLDYKFKVVAVNEAGESEPCVTKPVKAKDPWDVPGSPKIIV